MLNRNSRIAALLVALIIGVMAASFGFAGGEPGGKVHCNSGRGNGSELPNSGTAVTGQANDCDPGNSGAVNHGGDFAR